MIQSLYRGKRKDNGEWHEGHLVQMDGRAFIVSAYTASNDRRDWDEADKAEIHPYVDFRHVEVDPDTVGRMWMMSNKGERVFNGDLFLDGDRSYDDHESPIIYELRHLEGMMYPVLVDVNPGVYSSIHLTHAKNYKLLGNKWDHPHLLQKETAEQLNNPQQTNLS